MEDIYQRVIDCFEKAVRKLNQEARTVSGPCRALEVVVLGQQALLMRREQLPGLTLLATTDFDAHLKGEVPLEDVFKNCLREHSISYDEESIYIWMPEETEYEELYRSEHIIMKAPLPVYLLVSKALHARKKNRQLVIDAIANSEFADRLLELMEKYGVDLEYFLGDTDEE